MKEVDLLCLLSVLLNFGGRSLVYMILDAEGLNHGFVSATEMV